jgi:hypothetical protein
MEYKKGSYLLVGGGTFTGRFQAIKVISDSLIQNISDNKTEEATEKYVSDNKVEIKAGCVLAARDGGFLRSVTISKGDIEIIF